MIGNIKHMVMNMVMLLTLVGMALHMNPVDLVLASTDA
jgi:hypothetical protein